MIKQNMKNLLFWISFLMVIPGYAQKNEKIEEKLREKYGFVYLSDFDENALCYIVGSDGHVGACDLNGKEIVPPQYDHVLKMCSGNFCYFLTTKGEQRGIYNLNGKEIIPPKWHSVVGNDAGEGYFEVLDGEISNPDRKTGLYDGKGKMILPCEYYAIIGLNSWDYNGYLLPWKNKKCGLTDNKGNWILPCEYTKIIVYDSLGIAVAAKGGEKNKNSYIYGLPYNAKWGIFTLKGKELVPCEYDYIGKNCEGLFLCSKGCKIQGDDEVVGGKYGYLDKDGKLVVPLKYDAASDFSDGVAQVTENNVTSILTNPLTGTRLQLANGGNASKVDTNIPETGRISENTFAFIIANENYNNFTGADYSINDGKIFREYCKKTFGLPEKNIRYYEDATYGNLVSAINKIVDIADVYDGDARIIFYYSGLGTTDNTKESYLLPVDASIEALNSTGYSVHSLLDCLNALKTEMTIVIFDAPFSGTDKTGKMLAKHRGVQLAPKPTLPKGNTVLCLSSCNSETSYSNAKYSHGLFTYALLDKIQSSKGLCSVKDALEYATQWVKRNALSELDASQNPTTNISANIEKKYENAKW